MFKVITAFYDAKDDMHLYNAGDVYPRKGYKPTESRCKQLASNKNSTGTPLIEEVKDEVKARKK